MQRPAENPAIAMPRDIEEKLEVLSTLLGEPPREIVIAAVEHFTRIPEQQQKAIMKGTALRRRR